MVTRKYRRLSTGFAALGKLCLSAGIALVAAMIFQRSAMAQAPLFHLNADASEVNGVSNGSIVTPTVAPVGLTGTVVQNAGGSVNFTPAQVGNGVYFLNCCGSNNAYYKFKGSSIGSIFNTAQGQVTFYLK